MENVSTFFSFAFTFREMQRIFYEVIEEINHKKIHD